MCLSSPRNVNREVCLVQWSDHWPVVLNSCHLLALLSSLSLSTHCFALLSISAVHLILLCLSLDRCISLFPVNSFHCQPELYRFTWPSTLPSLQAELKRNQWSHYLLSTLLRSVYCRCWECLRRTIIIIIIISIATDCLFKLCPLFNLFHLIWVVINDANVIIVQ